MIKELSSFRDPNSYLMHDGEFYYRKINSAYLKHFNYFKESGLKKILLNRGDILPFEEVEKPENLHIDFELKMLKTKKLDFVSYPYEWSFSQFKIAALFTLKINLIALEYGMILKDASMFNVQFVGCKPVFIDLASFEIYENDKPWIAYYQFCKHFYAPLFVSAKKSVFFQKLLLYFIDGIPLKEAVSLCKGSDFLSFGSLIHLYLHSKGENKVNKKNIDKKVSKKQLINIVNHLSFSIEKLKPSKKETIWDNYNLNNNYLEESKLHKANIIKGFIEQQVNCKTALDIGANDGSYSKLFSDKGIYTLVVDIDEVAIDRAFSENYSVENIKIHPLHINLVNPTPSIGWNNVERKSFWDRCQVDIIQALAVVHHLVITHDISFEEIASKFAMHATYLIIEFVHPEDIQAQKLLHNKPHHRLDYTCGNFEEAFNKFFTLSVKTSIYGMKRDLYFYDRR